MVTGGSVGEGVRKTAEVVCEVALYLKTVSDMLLSLLMMHLVVYKSFTNGHSRMSSVAQQGDPPPTPQPPTPKPLTSLGRVRLATVCTIL